MKKGLQLLVFILLSSLSVFSQINRYGTPLISQFDAANTPGELRNLCITMDSRGVMYFGNEAGGIVTYDGSRWGKIATPGTGAVTTLVTDARGLVYAGGRTGFGLLEPDGSGRLTYKSLADRIAVRSASEASAAITSSAADSNNVFLSDGMRLYIIGHGGDSVIVSDLEKNYGLRNVSALLIFDNRLIIADDREGLYDYNGGEARRLPGGEKTAPASFVRLLPYDRENLLIGDAQRDLRLFNIRTGTLRSLKAGGEGKTAPGRGLLADIALLPGNQIAAGFTDRGGVYIFSHEGKLLQQISDRTGSVTESSVTAMYCHYTSNSQLWFCTIGFINRAYVSMPASGFTSASGITSVIGQIADFHGDVWAGAEDGLHASYTDPNGIRRFKTAGSQGVSVNALSVAKMPGGNVLLAATDNGLLQVNGDDDTEKFLPGLHLTAFCLQRQDNSVLVAGSHDGIIRILFHDGYEWMIRQTFGSGVKGRITDIEQSAPGEWWIVTSDPSSLVRMHCEASDTTFIIYSKEKGVTSDTVNSLAVINDNLYLCSGRGIFIYSRQDDAFLRDHDLTGTTFDEANIRSLTATPEGEIVVSGHDSRNFDAIVTATRQGHVVFRRQFDFLPDLASTGVSFADGSIWLARGNNLFVLDKSKLGFRYGDFSTLFTRIIAGRGKILMDGSFYTISAEGDRIPSATQPGTPEVTLNHHDNSITFAWTTTSYVDEEKTEYRQRLEGFDDEWSPWEKRNYRDYTNLPSGDYRFVVRARTITGLEGEDLSYVFSVRKPWYTSLVAKLFYSATGGWLLFLLIRYFARRLRIRNRKLDSLLRQRNEATARGRNEIEGLEKYAGTVQQALLPSEKRLAEAIPNSFLLNRPKGPVTGDFFWMSNRNQRAVIAVGDSTGHGVPSALRTVMALCFLDDIADKAVTITTSEILREFRSRLAETVASLPAGDIQQEGIDISLLKVDRARNMVEYSGAAMQCLRVREMNDQEKARWDNGEFKPNEGTQVSGKYLLETVYGDRVPLGMHLDSDHAFTQHTWKLEKDSSYYLFTDGYPDQFNGATGKKFLRKNLRKLILDIQNYPMSKQKAILEERLGSWMGKAPQTDDILVAGIRIE